MAFNAGRLCEYRPRKLLVPAREQTEYECFPQMSDSSFKLQITETCTEQTADT